MRARAILLVSLVLNVALGVALVTWLTSAPNTSPRVVRSINAAEINSNVVRIIKTNVLVRPRAFTWLEVESPDYEIYVQNLRALGMPDSTVRDVIVADVDQIFVRRQRDEVGKQDIEWWRSTPSYEAQSNALARARQIQADRAELLAKLLGPDWQQGRAPIDPPPLALAGPVLGSLPAEVKDRVQDIAARSRARVGNFIGQAESSGQQPGTVELAKMREETRAELAAILSPAQLEEFLLRYSESANQLRRELTGFNATPEEFRALFRAVDALDRVAQLGSGDESGGPQAAQNLEQQRLAAIRAALTPERFAAYQTLQDPVYRTALATAQRAGAGEEAAQALYEISRATREEFNRIRSDPKLTDAQKQQQLRETILEQQRARSLVLGETPAVETAPASAAETPAPAVAAIPPPQPFPHAVEPGESLVFLALRFGVSMEALKLKRNTWLIS